MTPEEYLRRSNNIQEREAIIRGQIDNHVLNGNPNVRSNILDGLVLCHQEIIDEYAALDREFLDDA
mgnify:CR=1 FL=1